MYIYTYTHTYNDNCHSGPPRNCSKSAPLAPSQPAVERKAEDPDHEDIGDLLTPELEVKIRSDFSPGENNT